MLTAGGRMQRLTKEQAGLASGRDAALVEVHWLVSASGSPVDATLAAGSIESGHAPLPASAGITSTRRISRTI